MTAGIPILAPLLSTLFLPGYAWLLVSGLARRMNQAEQATLAFVISTAALSLLSAALSLITRQYLAYSLILSVGGSSIVLITYWLRRRPRAISFPSLHKIPKSFLFCTVAYVIIILLSFWSAPYYPTAEAPDLVTHTHLTQTILAGDGRNVLLHGDTPVGLHFASAVIAYVLQVAPLEALRITIAPALLAIASLFFFSARRMFGSSAAIVVLVGSFVLPVDLIHFFRVGTYPNLLEDCILLGILWLLVSFREKPSKPLGLTMSLLSVAGVFIHSSFFLFFAAILITIPIVYFVGSGGEFRNYLHALFYAVGGLLLFAAILWPFFSGNIGRIMISYVEPGQPLVSSVLRISYFNFGYDLGYFIGWVNVAVLFASIISAIFLGKKSVWSVLLLVWLGLQFASPTFSEQSYRFVLFAMIPASFLIGKQLGDLRTWTLALRTWWRKLREWAVPLLLVILILSGSLPSLVPKIASSQERVRQEAIFDSMQWLSQHSSCRVVASSGLWPDYIYLSALTPLNYTTDFQQPADTVLVKSADLGFTCIAVSNQTPCFNTYQTNTHFKELYHNELVWVYAILR